MAVFKPSSAEVVAAVKSLYIDELKPFGRFILRRIGERAAATSGDEGHHNSIPYIDAKRLRRICRTCKLLHMEAEEAGEYSVLIIGHPSTFIDSSDPNDPFPAELWAEMQAYCECLGNDSMFFPGGRYACAQVLVARHLPFLSGRSLGEVCHLIQLAIAKHRILGYYGGYMVPFSRSETWIKEQCAALQQPLCTLKQASTPRMRVATWNEALTCLQEILERAPGGVLPLSNVKRFFRSWYHLDLHETMLGYTRLFELLQDPRFRSVCSVQQNGTGYVVVSETKYSVAQRNGSFDTSTVEGSLSPASSSDDCEIWEPFPDGTEADSPDVCRGMLTQNFCKRALSLDFKDICTLIDETSASSPTSLRDAVQSSLFSQSNPTGDNCFVRNTFVNITPPKHNTSSKKRSKSEPKDLGSNRDAWAAVRNVLFNMSPPQQQQQTRLAWVGRCRQR